MHTLLPLNTKIDDFSSSFLHPASQRTIMMNKRKTLLREKDNEFWERVTQ